MYGVDMYYTVKTLLSKGKSQRKIATELGISRNTVSDIAKSISYPTTPMKAVTLIDRQKP